MITTVIIGNIVFTFNSFLRMLPSCMLGTELAHLRLLNGIFCIVKLIIWLMFNAI